MQVVAWDFDGVLNRNIVDGRFIWADRFEADFGHPRAGFEAHVFRRDLDAIMTGREDLRDRVAEWAEAVGYAGGPDAVLAYWFAKDRHPDPVMLELMERLRARGVRQVIATNNEARRARYIEEDMGFGLRVERVFASGRMGVAKPSSGFFTQVTDSLGVAPEDMFLVDDLAPNMAAARRLGWQGFHVTPERAGALDEALGL